jgi:hypothetical protein
MPMNVAPLKQTHVEPPMSLVLSGSTNCQVLRPVLLVMPVSAVSQRVRCLMKHVLQVLPWLPTILALADKFLVHKQIVAVLRAISVAIGVRLLVVVVQPVVIC